MLKNRSKAMQGHIALNKDHDYFKEYFNLFQTYAVATKRAIDAKNIERYIDLIDDLNSEVSLLSDVIKRELQN